MTPATIQPTLRPASPNDEPFLARLYASTRDDLAAAGLDHTMVTALMNQQYAAQRAAYAGYEHAVVELDGGPVGRLVIDRAKGELRVVDIALMPEVRGRGIGTMLLRSVQHEAASTRLPVQLRVLPENPALRLYARLGFTERGVHGVHVAMEWRGDQ